MKRKKQEFTLKTAIAEAKILRLQMREKFKNHPEQFRYDIEKVFQNRVSKLETQLNQIYQQSKLF